MELLWQELFWREVILRELFLTVRILAGIFLAGNVPSTRKISYVVVRVVSGVGAESVVEVAENLLGQKRVLSLEGVGSRVEEDLDEVGLDHSAPENIGKMNA